MSILASTQLRLLARAPLAQLARFAPALAVSLPVIARCALHTVRSNSQAWSGSGASARPEECPTRQFAPEGTCSHWQRFPDAVWSRIAGLFPYRTTHPTIAINVGFGAGGKEGYTTTELEHRGFRVIDVRLDPIPTHRRCCLEATAEAGEQDAANLNRADMVTFMHVMHLLDHDRAAQAAYRHLRPGGLLLVAFNDRDRHPPFGRELELLLSSYSAAYRPLQSYRGMMDWGQKLQAGHLFELKEHSRHPHELRLHSAGALMDSVEGLSLHSLHPSDSHQLRSALAELAKRHFGSEEDIRLPLETKLFILERLSEEHAAALEQGHVPRDPGLPPPTAPAAEAAAAGGAAPRSWEHRGPAGMSPEKRCLFCGSPIAD